MEKKKFFTVKKIILFILIILLIAVGVVLLINYRNIKSIYRGLTTNIDDIQQQMTQNDQNIADALAESGISLTKEELDLFSDGSLSQDEISAIILKSMTEGSADEVLPDAEKSDDDENGTENTDVTAPETSTDSSNGKATGSEKSSGDTNAVGTDTSTDTSYGKANGGGKGTSSASNGTSKSSQNSSNASALPKSSGTDEAEYNKKVADLIAKVYVIKANFTSSLAAFENDIISSYKALPTSERTNANKAKIVADNMSYALGLEAQCDAQIAAVTDELTALLKQYGKDTALVDSINSAYQQEKELKKAYYLSLYK